MYYSAPIHRFAIFGISLKKFDLSTSLTVALQVILYENKWARSAWLTGIPRPPKKKKLRIRTATNEYMKRMM